MGVFAWIIIIFALIGFIVMPICFFAVAPKIMGKSMKKMMPIQKELMSDMIDMEKEILTDKEEDLKYMADKNAEISKDAITKTTRAIKDGLTDEVVFCKHCGAEIDADSSFCKKCGKQQ